MASIVSKNPYSFLRALAVIGLVFATAALANAQQPASLEGKTAEQAYKNITVLKGIPADLVIPAMKVMNASLGVDCSYCHTPPDYAGDQKDEKRTARRMIGVALGVNDGTVVAVDPRTGHLVSLFKQYPLRDHRLVTCFTCHHGGINPVEPSHVDSSNGGPSTKADAQPSNLAHADQLFENFIDAVGGVPALRKITTCHITATREAPGTVPQPIELYEKANNVTPSLSPVNSLISAQTPLGTVLSGSDGKITWRKIGTHEADESSTAGWEQIRRSTNVYASLYLKQKYSLIMTVGVEDIRGQAAYRVDGFVPNGNPDHLYFDKDSGLLLRIVSVSTTPAGDSLTTTDFDDYRAVEGIKLPFAVRIANSDQDLRTEVHVNKVEFNVPIEDNKFARPVPTASPKTVRQ